MLVHDAVPIKSPDSGALIRWHDTTPAFAYPTQETGVVIAQQFDQDVLGDLSDAFNTFVESGQVWALLIGIVIGYLIRSLTAY